MGQEIARTDFTNDDFFEFHRKLNAETRLLMDWFRNDYFEKKDKVCGTELETCLVDKNYLPSPTNEDFLSVVNHPQIVPELSRFNFEINSNPYDVDVNLLTHLHCELNSTWSLCNAAAEKIGNKLIAIGITPTMKEGMLSLDTITPLKRYYALDKQTRKHRKGKISEIDIKGVDTLRLKNQGIMLAGATTSLQIHLQVTLQNACRYYNAAHILSAPIVAATCNSPYLFGKELWAETRIPLYEQSVDLDGFKTSQGEMVKRVTFGTGYAQQSLIEPFLENLNGFPVLLPMTLNVDKERLCHLRLQNGSIWRWIRPLVDISEKGKPHLRIEHRAVPSGPSIPDMIANIAFFIGLAHEFATRDRAPEKQLSFKLARENFYSATKYGLDTEIHWLDGKMVSAQKLLLESLLPASKKSLLELGVSKQDVAYYLDDVLKHRILKGQTGAAWQKAFIAKKGPDFQAMAQTYIENQQSGKPVHEWIV